MAAQARSNFAGHLAAEPGNAIAAAFRSQRFMRRDLVDVACDVQIPGALTGICSGAVDQASVPALIRASVSAFPLARIRAGADAHETHPPAAIPQSKSVEISGRRKCWRIRNTCCGVHRPMDIGGRSSGEKNSTPSVS